jgi:hypothetical protein
VGRHGSDCAVGRQHPSNFEFGSVKRLERCPIALHREREEFMLYLVEAHPTVERANIVDAGEGPGPVFAKIVERFSPQAIYGNPSRRQVFMVVDLDTPAKMAELMYVLAWFIDVEPTFTPLMSLEIYGEAIAKAKQIITPQKSAS